MGLVTPVNLEILELCQWFAQIGDSNYCRTMSYSEFLESMMAQIPINFLYYLDNIFQ